MKRRLINWQFNLVIIVFIILTFWWLLLQLNPGNEENNTLFGAIYGVIALLGGIYGIFTSQKWGGMRSVMGKSIIMFSLGLLAQEFGQLIYSYNHYIFHQEGLYPSLGDLGFFGSIPLYIYGVLLLGQASGVRFSLKSVKHKLQGILIPLSLLIFSYFFFLQGYEFDWSKPLTILLDFGYPLGQAVYISLALLIFLLSRNVLGGVMKYRVLIILLALFMQYLSDFTFLFQASKGTWTAGGINDYMYLISYFAMTLGLLQLNIKLINNKLDSKNK